MQSLWDRLAEKWVKDGITARPGASDALLDSFEAQSGVRLPPDFRAYLGRVDGMDPLIYGVGGVRFWPLSELTPANRQLDLAWLARYPTLYLFGDYAVEACYWGIQLTPQPASGHPIVTVACSAGEEDQVLATSITEFFEKYLKDLKLII